MFIIVLANMYCSCFLQKERICFSYCSPINHVFYPEDDWLITSFCFKVASCSFAYLTRSVLVHCSLSTMYPHSYHTCTFFHNSTLFTPVDVIINCFVFHYILQLTTADADLYWSAGCCFICSSYRHHSEVCPHHIEELTLMCTLLLDPHCEYCFSCLLQSSNSSLQIMILVLPITRRVVCL